MIEVQRSEQTQGEWINDKGLNRLLFAILGFTHSQLEVLSAANITPEEFFDLSDLQLEQISRHKKISDALKKRRDQRRRRYSKSSSS